MSKTNRNPQLAKKADQLPEQAEASQNLPTGCSSLCEQAFSQPQHLHRIPSGSRSSLPVFKSRSEAIEVQA